MGVIMKRLSVSEAFDLARKLFPTCSRIARDSGSNFIVVSESITEAPKVVSIDVAINWPEGMLSYGLLPGFVRARSSFGVQEILDESVPGRYRAVSQDGDVVEVQVSEAEMVRFVDGNWVPVDDGDIAGFVRDHRSYESF